jgi:hypothetical protein
MYRVNFHHELSLTADGSPSLVGSPSVLMQLPQLFGDFTQAMQGSTPGFTGCSGFFRS